MREKVLQYIRERSLIRAGDRVAVAVSGGADSVALLRVLLELRAELGIVLFAAHFNHGLRGEAAVADEALVAATARAHGLEFFAGHGDVRDHAFTSKLSLEAAGRELRYRWFGEIASEQRLDAVATAHTLDDQAETVLLKFLRGAGTRGLAGIYPLIVMSGAKAPAQKDSVIGAAEAAPFHRAAEAAPLRRAPLQNPSTILSNNDSSGIVSERESRYRAAEAASLQSPVEMLQPRWGETAVSPRREPWAGLGQKPESRRDRTIRIIRPLLNVSRTEVEAYLASIGQSWREDESNLDRRFLRNRVRHELLPLLERDYNPNIRCSLSDLAEVARGEEKYWRDLVAHELGARLPGIKPETISSADADLKVGSSTGHSFPELSSAGPSATDRSSVAPSATGGSSTGQPSVRFEERFGTTRNLDGGLSDSADVAEKLTANETRATRPKEFRGEAPDDFADPNSDPNRTRSTGLQLTGFSESAIALQRRILKGFAEEHQLALDFGHIERLRRCALREVSQAELPGGVIAISSDGSLRLQSPQPRTALSYKYELSIPGEIDLGELGLRLRAYVVSPQFAQEMPPDELLSLALLASPLTVRNWCPGDRFAPAHSRSEEKLKRLFLEKRIPAADRPAWPVVLCGEQIVWVRGFPVAKSFRWQGEGQAVRIEIVERRP